MLHEQGAYQVRDLAEITLFEPHIEHYKAQGRAPDDLEEEEEDLYALPDDHPVRPVPPYTSIISKLLINRAS